MKLVLLGHTGTIVVLFGHTISFSCMIVFGHAAARAISYINFGNLYFLDEFFKI